MKKSMLLSFVTAGAIIATSVGTYATWDQLSGVTDSAVTVNYGKAVITTATMDAKTIELAGTDSINGNPTAEVEFKVKVDNLPTSGTNKLKFGLVDSTSGSDLTPNGFDVNYYRDDDTDRATPLSEVTITDGAEITYVAKISLSNPDGARPDTTSLTSSFKVKATLTNTPDAA